MPSAANIVFGATLAACLAIIVRTSTTSSFRFSPALLFVAIFILQQAFGCIGLVHDGDPAGSRARIGLGLGIAGVALGTWVANAWARFDPRELGQVRTRFELRTPHRHLEIGVVLAGYLVSVAFLAFYFQHSGGIPLVQGIGAFVSGDEVRMAQQLLKEKRMEMTYFEASTYRGQGYVDQIRMVALPYCVACLALWAAATRRRKWMLLAAVAALPAALFLMGTGQRHPVAAFLLAMTILGYTVMPARLHGKLLGWFGGVGFAVFFVMTYLLGRYTHTDDFGQDMLMVFQGIWNRIVYSNAYGTLALFDLFPNPEPFRWGSTWLNDLQGFLPGPYVAFSSWLYRRLYGAVGTAAPMCFGEMYANFGLLGVLIGGLCIGVFLQMLQVAWARQQRYHVEHIVLYALGSMAFMRWAMGGLLAPIQHGAVALPMLVVGVRAGREFLRGVDAARRASFERDERFDSARVAPAGLRPAYPEASDP